MGFSGGAVVRLRSETFVDGWKFDPFEGGQKSAYFQWRFCYLKLSRPKANCRESLCFFLFLWRMFGWGRPGHEENELSTNLQEFVTPRKGDSLEEPQTPFCTGNLKPPKL